MNMKNCLKALACLALGVGMLSQAPAAEAKKKPVIGIQLYSVMDAMNKDAKGSLARLADMGYNTLELVQWGGEPKVFGMPAPEFKATTDALGQTVLSTHSGIQEDPAKEDEVMNRWCELFKIQKSLGGKYFVIPSYQADYTKAGIKQMADYFNRVGKLAKEYGLKLGYHNHSGEFQKLKDGDELMWEYLLANTDPDLVCFELDVYWAKKGGQSPVELLKKHPKRIPILHIKDEFVLGDTGEIDFEGIFKQFHKNGMKDYVVEIETPGFIRDKTNADGSKYSQEQINEEMFIAAKKSADYLRNSGYLKK